MWKVKQNISSFNRLSSIFHLNELQLSSYVRSSGVCGKTLGKGTFSCSTHQGHFSNYQMLFLMYSSGKN